MIKNKKPIEIVETPIIDGYDFHENNGIINPAFFDAHKELVTEITNRDKLLDIDYRKNTDFQRTGQTFHHYSSPELPETQPISNGQSLASSWVYEFNNGSSSPRRTNTMANSTAPLSVMYRSPYGPGYSEQPMHLSYDMDLSHEHSKKSKDRGCCQCCPSLMKLFVWTVIIISIMGIAISIAFIIYIEKFAADDCCGPNNKTIGQFSGNHSTTVPNILTDINKTVTKTTDSTTGITTTKIIEDNGIPTEITKTFKTGLSSLFTTLSTTPLTTLSNPTSTTFSTTLSPAPTTTSYTTLSSSLFPKVSPNLTIFSSEKTETTVTEKSTVTYSSHGVTESINTSPIIINRTQIPNKTTEQHIPTTIRTEEEQEKTITTTTSSSITETTPTRPTDIETTTQTSLERRALNITNQLKTTITTTKAETETESTNQSASNSTETITSSSLSSDIELTTLSKAMIVKATEDQEYDSSAKVIKTIKSNTEPTDSSVNIVSTTTVANN